MKYQKATAEKIQFDSSDILAGQTNVSVNACVSPFPGVNVVVHDCDWPASSQTSVDIGQGSDGIDVGVKDCDFLSWNS